MKVKLLIIISALLVFTPVAVPKVTGIQEYRNEPQSVSENVYVRVPFFTTIMQTLQFSYIVFGPSAEEVYRQTLTSVTLSRNETYEMTYRDQSRMTKVGRNSIIFTYKTNRQTAWSTHTSYFYGYSPATSLNLNSATAFATINEEYTYIYNGVSTTGYLIRSYLEVANLTGTLYFSNDFYFNFDELYLKIIGAHESALYEEAVLYFEEGSLFPLFSQVSGTAALKLTMVKEGDYYRFSSFRELYVDPLTHLVSSHYKPGFIATPYLYFPKSRYGSVEDVKARLEIKSFLYHKYNAVYRFSLEIGRPYLGSGGEHEVIIKRGAYVV